MVGFMRYYHNKSIQLLFLGRVDIMMKFVVFLDVDGTLIDYETKLPDSARKAVDQARANGHKVYICTGCSKEILANAIEKCGGGEIILSSDWKNLDKDHDDYKYLVSKLAQCNLKISGHTTDRALERGKGIKEYLELHPEIEEYVILDDYTFEFEHYKKLWERLLLTRGIENVRFASRTPAVEAILFENYIKEF